MSSGGSKNSTVTQTTQFPPEFMGYARNILDQGMATAQQPYQAYPGQQVAPESAYTQQARDLTAQRAISGSPTDQAAQQQATDTLQGGYFRGLQANPYIGATTGFNPYIGATIGVGANPYAGQNPYLEQSIRSMQDDVSRAYATGTAAQTDAAASRAGVLGSSGYNELTGIQSGELAKRLGDISSGMRMQDYQLQQQLAESDINRRLGASQTDIARNAGLMESGLGRLQSDIGRSASLAESALGREQTAYQAERENQMRTLGLSPALQSMDYTNLSQLGQAGAGEEGYQQRLLDTQYQNWLAQQRYPYEQAQFGAGLLAPLAGSQGTTTSPYQGTSPIMGAAGGAMLGYGATSALGSAAGGAMATPYAPWIGALLGAGLGYLGSR